MKKGNASGSQKYAGKWSALYYKLDIDILERNPVLIQGSYPAGKYMDINFFDKVWWNFLEPAGEGG